MADNEPRHQAAPSIGEELPANKVNDTDPSLTPSRMLQKPNMSAVLVSKHHDDSFDDGINESESDVAPGVRPESEIRMLESAMKKDAEGDGGNDRPRLKSTVSVPDAEGSRVSVVEMRTLVRDPNIEERPVSINDVPIIFEDGPNENISKSVSADDPQIEVASNAELEKEKVDTPALKVVGGKDEEDDDDENKGP